MLVLTRKDKEQVLIGTEIVLTIIKSRMGSVSIGIEAPEHLRILRREVHARDIAEAAAKNASQTS